METQNAHENAARLKLVLLILLAAALAWSAFSLYRLGAGVWELLHPALADAPGSAKADPWAALATVDGANWVSMVVWIAVLPVLGKCLLILFKAPWGKDFSWSDGQWMDTDPMALRPGSGLPLAEPLKESINASKIGLGALGVMAIPALWAAAMSIDMPANGASVAPLDLAPLFGALLFASFVGYTCAASFTRRVQFDDAGVCDANFFRSHRVAWSVIKSVDSGNGTVSAAGQPGAVGLLTGDWQLRDAQGRTMLRLANDMAPQESFEALRRRVVSRSSPSVFGFLDIEAEAPAPERAKVSLPANQAKPAGQARTCSATRSTGSTRATRSASSTNSASLPKKKRQWTEEEKEAARESARQASKARAKPAPERLVLPVPGVQRPPLKSAMFVVISAAMTLFLLVIPAVNSTYDALWLIFAGERVVGVVVEIPPDDTPTLVVEYREINTSNVGPQRLQSFGSDFYEDYKVGDEVAVLYDPAQSGIGARLDLFLELWLGSILLWCLVPIGLAVTRSMARSLRARHGV